MHNHDKHTRSRHQNWLLKGPHTDGVRIAFFYPLLYFLWDCAHWIAQHASDFGNADEPDAAGRHWYKRYASMYVPLLQAPPSSCERVCHASAVKGFVFLCFFGLFVWLG